MKRTLLVLILFNFIWASAQITEGEKALKKQRTDSLNGWKKGGAYAINFSQLSLSNWAAGGLNSVSLNSFFNCYAFYTRDSLTWDSSLDLGFGMIRQGRTEGVWLKSDDKIDFSSKVGYKYSEKAYFAGLLNFRTQFTRGYETVEKTKVISNILAPAFLVCAIGIDYKPANKVSFFAAPITYKSTIVMDDSLSMAGGFGVQPGEVYRSEFGGYLRIQMVRDIMKNVNYSGKIDLFSNYFNNPENIDVNWENTFTMKINAHLNANLMTHLIYDDDIMIAIDRNEDGFNDASGPRLQFKQLFGAGFAYKF